MASSVTEENRSNLAVGTNVRQRTVSTALEHRAVEHLSGTNVVPVVVEIADVLFSLAAASVVANRVLGLVTVSSRPVSAAGLSGASLVDRSWCTVEVAIKPVVDKRVRGHHVLDELWLAACSVEIALLLEDQLPGFHEKPVFRNTNVGFALVVDYHAPPERVTDPELHDVSRGGETPGPRVNTVVHFVGRLSGAKVLDRKVESQWVTTIASGLSIDHCAFVATLEVLAKSVPGVDGLASSVGDLVGLLVKVAPAAVGLEVVGKVAALTGQVAERRVPGGAVSSSLLDGFRQLVKRRDRGGGSADEKR